MGQISLNREDSMRILNNSESAPDSHRARHGLTRRRHPH